ncbi:MAG: hypothetical protein JWM61_2894 [Micrococcaceae bacterium]|nr:hypothetical protein [Micrococcaceae bacterium]
MAIAQQCTTEGCVNTTAFSTRTKPTWCEPCLIAILSELGMDPMAPFPGKDSRWRTRCRDCSAECDYKLDYLLELRTRDEPSCRRCFWIQWATAQSNPTAVPKSVVGGRLTENDVEPIEELVDLPRADWPVITRCIRCGIQQAQRLGDIAWGCVCSRNGKSSSAPSPASRSRGAKNLFVDSQNPALEWWDHDRNPASALATVAVRSNKEHHWKCLTCAHLFTATVSWMTGGPQCPECETKRRAEWDTEWPRLKQTPVAEIPELLAAWNDAGDPRTIMVAENMLRKFRCENGHQPRIAPYTFMHSGCQYCRSAQNSHVQRVMLADALPEIASQWHPTLNGKLTPEKVVPGSKRMAHWLADCCGHEWEEPVRNRDKYQRLRCPQCRTILGSLGWVDPGFAAEWEPSNPSSPWHLRPHGQTAFTPRWICSVDPAHRWEATLTSRSSGSECPECKQVGKSRVELRHKDAAKEIFEVVKSGPVVRNEAFTTRKQWSIDILVEHEGLKVAVEYDGARWHRPAPKIEVDRRKSRDLLAAGYRVVRLREDDLPSLGIESPDYLELQVYSTAPKPEVTLARIQKWLALAV